ncbi:MAG: M23 family metallopeptidase [Rhodospirillaceae bacterium]|nr:M23 family metallopeptidase [Rhodospirillaceae bacterium]
MLTAFRGSLAGLCGLLLAVFAMPAGPISTSSILRPYVPESPHKAYGVVLAELGSDRASPLHAWVNQADRAILEPTPVTLPFEATGDLAAIEPGAEGYLFPVESGRRVQVELFRAIGAERSQVFVDLFRLDRGIPRYVSSTLAVPAGEPAPPSQRITVDPLGDVNYIVRVQPGLQEKEGRYRLAIRLEPQLHFPVSGHGTDSIQSGFGAARDGGAREHHGVDIFAPRGTPVLASLDARVRRVDITDLGGKVVWLEPLFGSTRLYYAHLDSQSVQAGQYVFAGEMIGTVGNTGNARTTPPHLHFGVYLRNRGGPRDPYPFLKQASR